MLVVGLPLGAAFVFGERFGFFATVLSIGLSFALAHFGTVAWKRWPGSRDVVFNDLMLWGFARRVVTQKRLIRRVERLGVPAEDPDHMTLQERTKLLKSLASGLEKGDPYTHGHSQRVARHAYMVAKAMKLSRREAEKIRLAGVIHDVGKLRIPRAIITKPGKLTDAEFDVIKRHTVDGAAMVEVLGDPEVTDIVRHHHERLDGSGYPDNLVGDEISIGARVLAVADTFDAASSRRPYRPAQKHKVALDILEEEARSGRLDPDVVDAFVRYYSGRRALRWWALLSAGPAHLHDLPLAVVQRVGTASLANAAIVGVTAVALAPGSPLHGGVDAQEERRRNRPAVTKSEERDGPGRAAVARAGEAGGFHAMPATGDGLRSKARTERKQSSPTTPRHAKGRRGEARTDSNRSTAGAKAKRNGKPERKSRAETKDKDHESSQEPVAAAIGVTTDPGTGGSGTVKNDDEAKGSSGDVVDEVKDILNDAGSVPAPDVKDKGN